MKTMSTHRDSLWAAQWENFLKELPTDVHNVITYVGDGVTTVSAEFQGRSPARVVVDHQLRAPGEKFTVKILRNPFLGVDIMREEHHWSWEEPQSPDDCGEDILQVIHEL